MPHTRVARTRNAFVVMTVFVTVGGVSAQNVGSYGMATKPPPPTPETLATLEISEATQKALLGKTIPLDGTFYDHAGAAVSLRELIGGKPTILMPVYFRCPLLCNTMVENLVDCLRRMRAADPEMSAGRAFNVILFSIDDHEHPKIAAPRRELFHRDYDGRSPDEPGVWMLSANPGQFSDPTAADATIREVTDAIGYRFVKADRKGREIQHPTAVLVLTPTGQVSSYNTAITFDEREFRDQIRIAAKGETGTTSGRSALACFLGGDMSGMYRTTMRILGWASLPVLAIACGVVYLGWRKAKRESPQSTDRGSVIG